MFIMSRSKILLLGRIEYFINKIIIRSVFYIYQLVYIYMEH